MNNIIITGGNSSFANINERIQIEFNKIWENIQGNQSSLMNNKEQINYLKIFPVKNKVFANLEGKFFKNKFKF